MVRALPFKAPSVICNLLGPLDSPLVLGLLFTRGERCVGSRSVVVDLPGSVTEAFERAPTKSPAK